MSKPLKFLLKTGVASIVFVGVCGAAGLAGLVAVSHLSGEAPATVVKAGVNMMRAAGGADRRHLEALTENVMSLRTDFSAAFGALERRVQALETHGGGISPGLKPEETRSLHKAQLAPPPTQKPPSAQFGGGIPEERLQKSPKSKPPAFAYTPPDEPDVCREGCEFQTLNAAYGKTPAGGSITLAPQYYPECLIVKKSVLIVGQIGPNGERAEFDSACGGKGAFVVQAPEFELRGVSIRDISVSDRNGACVRVDPKAGSLRLNNVICANSQNGILANSSGPIFIDSSLFTGNGFGGRAHGIYVNKTPELIIRNTIVQSTTGSGHTLKSGASRTIIENSVLAALNSQNSRAIDLFGGGTLVVTGSVLQQGPNSENHDFIHFAGESRRINFDAEQIAVLEDNWFIYDHKPDRCCRWLGAGRKLGPIIFRNNRFVGINDTRIEDITLEGNEEHADRSAAGLPAYNGELASLPMPEAWQQ